MKNMFAVLCLAVSFNANSGSPVMKATPAFRQQVLTASFESIHLHKQGNGIKLQWMVSDASTVTGYDIECTYEDPEDIYSNWTLKGSLDATGRKMNMFSDNINIYSGLVHYRIIAHTGNGDIISPAHAVTIE